jgi:hypothetical protein
MNNSIELRGTILMSDGSEYGFNLSDTEMIAEAMNSK